jgi:hypothetical protein
VAEEKPKPGKVRKQRKFAIYQCLYNLNAAFEAIGREIETLDDHETVPVATLWRYRVGAEEIRAGLNHSVLGVLAGRELSEWTQFSKELRERQQQDLK